MSRQQAKAQKQEQKQQEQQQYSNFINSIGAKATKKGYSFHLEKFKEFVKGGDLFPSSTKEMEQNIIDYLSLLREKGYSHHYPKAVLVALSHFYSVNDVTINLHKIRRFSTPSSDQKIKRSRNGNAGYSTEQIQRVLEFCDERTRAIVLIYCSTGMRAAALQEIKVGDLELIDAERGGFQLYQITVYQGYREEYITYCTPECTKAIDSYLQYRQRSGEKLTDDSPLIREQFNQDEPFKAKHARSVAYQTIQKILKEKLVQSGVRTVVHTGESPGARIRKDVPLTHGFRKFFNTALMNADVHPIMKELLMGHSIKLDDFYYDKDSKKSKQKLLDEYVKAIDNLTISEENRLGLKVKQLTAKADEIMQLKLEMDSLKNMMRKQSSSQSGS